MPEKAPVYKITYELNDINRFNIRIRDHNNHLNMLINRMENEKNVDTKARIKKQFLAHLSDMYLLLEQYKDYVIKYISDREEDIKNLPPAEFSKTIIGEK